MNVEVSPARVVPISRAKLMLPAIGCAAFGLFLFYGAYMRGTGVFRRMIADPATDATLLGLVAFGMITLALSSLRPLIAGHHTVLSPDGVTAVNAFSDRSISWNEIVSVDVPTEAGDRVWLLRWQPGRFERLWTTRFAAVIDVRHTPWSVRDVLHALIELHPPLEAKMGPDIRSRYL